MHQTRLDRPASYMKAVKGSPLFVALRKSLRLRDVHLLVNLTTHIKLVAHMPPLCVHPLAVGLTLPKGMQTLLRCHTL